MRCRPLRFRGGLFVALTVWLLLVGGSAFADDYKTHYDAGVTAYRAGDYEAALAAYEKAFSLEAVPEAIYGIARCHHQLRHFGKAVASYDMFLAAVPDHEGAPRARSYLVEALEGVAIEELAARNGSGALKAVERAIALDSETEPAGSERRGSLHVRLGDVLGSLGRMGEAKTAYESALSMKLADDLRLRAAEGLERIAAHERSGGAASGGVGAPGAKKKKSAGVWIGVGVGAGVVVVAAVLTAVLVVVLPTRFERMIDDLGDITTIDLNKGM